VEGVEQRPVGVGAALDQPMPAGPENRHGNACRTVSRTLRTEQEAIRDIDITEARAWTVINPSSTNSVGYRLLTGENTVPFGAPGSPARRRAGFADHHLWVTPVDDDERYPAGEFPDLFERNPALDLPPAEPGAGSCHA
jgi:primary-amine oxidase